MKRAKRFLINAVLLTVTSVLMQSVSMAFNIYVSGEVGAQTIGLYTLIMSVYGLFLTFATSGVHLASVRLVSEAIGRGSDNEVSAVMKRTVSYAVIFGAAGMTLLLSLSEYIGRVWLADERCVRCLRILAFALPAVSITSALSGYFSAVRRVIKTASAQIVGEVVTIIGIPTALHFLLPLGTEYACIALVLGTLAAELISLVYMIILFLHDRHTHATHIGEVPPRLTKSMLSITLPVAFTAYAKSGLSTVKNLLVPVGLKKSGNSSTAALASYGMLHGMALPLVMLPQVMIASFSGLLIPEITNSRVLEHFNNVRYIIGRVLHFVVIYSVCVCGIFLFMAGDIGSIIYSDSAVSEYIMLLAPLVPFLYVDSIVDAALNGLNEQVRSMQINLIDATVSIILVWLVLPMTGIYGYIGILYVTKLLNSALSIITMVRASRLRINFIKLILKPVLCIAVSVGAVWILSEMTGAESAQNVFELVVKLITAVFIYILLIRGLNVIDKDDVEWIKGFFRKNK